MAVGTRCFCVKLNSSFIFYSKFTNIPLESSLVRPAVLCLRTEPRCPADLWWSRKLRSSSRVELVAAQSQNSGKKNSVSERKMCLKNNPHMLQLLLSITYPWRRNTQTVFAFTDTRSQSLRKSDERERKELVVSRLCKPTRI